MPSLLKISQQTLWQVLGKVITSISTIVILGIISRNYGEQGTGIFTLALTYLAIFYLLSDFGFNAHVLRNLKLEWNKLLGVRIVWSLFLVILAIVTLPFWPFSNSEFNLAVVLGSLAILGSGIFVTCNLIFQSKLRYDLSVLASGIGTVVSLGVFVYLSMQKMPVSFFMTAHLIGWIIIATLGLFMAGRFLPKLSPIYDKQYTINLFKGSWPIAATLTLNVVYFRADSFLIAAIKGVSDVGIYNVAYSVFQSALVLPTFIMNAYYPLMLKSFSGIKKVALGLLVLSIIGTLFTQAASPLIIKLITGGGFSGSSQSLQILSLGFPAYFLSALLMWVMVARGRYKQMFLIYSLGLLINLTLNFIYIPRYSFIAASYITVISEYLILGMQVIILREQK